MDFYLNNLHNFINTFRNNLHNEYNKNEILSNKISRYKKLYDENCIKKILVHTDKLIIQGIDNMYNTYTKKNYEKRLLNKNNKIDLLNKNNVMELSNNKMELINKNNIMKLSNNNEMELLTESSPTDYLYSKYNLNNSKDLTLYKNTIKNRLKSLYYRFKDWFLSKDKFFIEDNLIKDLGNHKNYTEEGLADYNLINGIQNIIDIRRIENPKDLIFEFEMTVLDNQKIRNKMCKIRAEKSDGEFKIGEISCIDL